MTWSKNEPLGLSAFGVAPVDHNRNWGRITP